MLSVPKRKNKVSHVCYNFKEDEGPAYYTARRILRKMKTKPAIHIEHSLEMFRALLCCLPLLCYCVK